MSESAASLVDEAPQASEVLSAMTEIVERDLKPLTVQIDLEGLYPESVMRKLGAAGAFSQHLPAARPDGGQDMPATIKAMSLVSQECLSTGFAMWCQDTCAWYLQNATNPTVREQYCLRRFRSCPPRCLKSPHVSV
ncbi:MAG: acyl-CoA dehydrogenase family protein [Gammaproteobacteria bacterium]